MRISPSNDSRSDDNLTLLVGIVVRRALRQQATLEALNLPPAGIPPAADPGLVATMVERVRRALSARLETRSGTKPQETQHTGL